jgi:hypothetical protein
VASARESTPRCPLAFRVVPEIRLEQAINIGLDDEERAAAIDDVCDLFAYHRSS